MTTIEPHRLARALQLEAQPLGDGRWRVTGLVSLHTVDLNGRDGGGCDCEDAQYRRTTCKHELAARLVAGDCSSQRPTAGHHC
jgi:hypothetical protein